MKNVSVAMIGRAALAVVFAFAIAGVAKASEPLLHPKPQKVKISGAFTAQKTFTLKLDGAPQQSVVEEYAERLRNWGFKRKDGGLTITLKRYPVEGCGKPIIPPYQSKNVLELPALQMFYLKTAEEGITVTACGEDGFFYALMTLRQLIKDIADGKVEVAKADITDYPAFPVRGVFEGGYGIWEKEGRLAVIDWMGSVKLNTYLYGPKGDPKIRRRWRELYDDIEMFQMKRIIERCAENHIQFGYVIAPTLGFGYGSDADYAALLKKLRQMQSLGARSFVVAFDDTLGMLYSPDDVKKFSSLADAETSVVNRVYGDLSKYDKEVTVVIVPEIYAGVHDMEYTRTIAKNLRPEVYIGWTGSQIGAPSFTAKHIEEFTKFYGRAPSFGDNWGSLFPLVARDRDTYKYMTQFSLNPYNIQGEMPIPGFKAVSEAALMPVEGASLAEFAWNPDAYDPDETLDRAASIYCPGAENIFKLVVYKDFYDFTSYYTLKTDYLTPIEKAAKKALESKSAEDADALADAYLPWLGVALSSSRSELEKCAQPEMGKQLAARAENYSKWFGDLNGTLIALKAAPDENSRKVSLDGLMKTLKGDKK